MWKKNFVYVLNYSKLIKELPPKKSMDILTAAKKEKEKKISRRQLSISKSLPLWGCRDNNHASFTLVYQNSEGFIHLHCFIPGASGIKQ